MLGALKKQYTDALVASGLVDDVSAMYTTAVFALPDFLSLMERLA